MKQTQTSSGDGPRDPGAMPAVSAGSEDGEDRDMGNRGDGEPDRDRTVAVSLRDFYAGMAMHALLTLDSGCKFDEIAEDAFNMSNTMCRVKAEGRRRYNAWKREHAGHPDGEGNR